MDEDTVRIVRGRANAACEYCLLPDDRHPGPFEVEHVVAIQHGGTDALGNLAYACLHCNRHKGPNLAGIDDKTFNACLELELITTNNLTIGLFWISPGEFIPADKKTRAFAKHNGVVTTPIDFQTYRQWSPRCVARLARTTPRFRPMLTSWRSPRRPSTHP